MTRYDILGRFLTGAGAGPLTLGFSRIEEILGRSLPDSARRHPAWWANTRTHSHAEAWMAVGWRTSGVDLAAACVVFERAPVGEAATPRPVGPGDLALDAARLTPAARRLLKDLADERGSSLAEAMAALVNAVAAERRRQLAHQFADPSPEDSA